MIVVAVGMAAYRLYRLQRRGKEIGPTDAVGVMPWDVLKHAFQQFRKAKFSTSGTSTGIYAEAELDTVIDAFASEHFASWNKLAYVYEGEEISMRRIEKVEWVDGERIWWQTHIRLFIEENGVRINSHLEKCPIEHPKEHLDEVGFDDEGADDTVRTILDRHDIRIVNEE